MNLRGILPFALAATCFSASYQLLPAQVGITDSARQPASGYNKPPKNILDVMHAPLPPRPVVSPAKDRMLLVARQPYPTIERVATPYLRLAGVRVEPKNHSKHDTSGGYGITDCVSTYQLVAIPSGKITPVTLPSPACVQEPLWSADGQRFAFANIAADSVEVWLGDPMTGAVHKVPGVKLNPMFGGEMRWMPDQKTLLVKLVPDGMVAPQQTAEVPAGPSIQESDGQKGQSSTYETATH